MIVTETGISRCIIFPLPVKFRSPPVKQSSKILIFTGTGVWQDSRNGGSGDYWNPSGNWEIYMYNISTKKETRITTNGSRQINPAIYGDKIV